MKTINLSQVSKSGQERLIQRPGISYDTVIPVVENIIHEVKQDGDSALKKFSKKFDGVSLENIKVSLEEINGAENNVSTELKSAIKKAYSNIFAFHKSQIFKEKKVENTKDVVCWRESRAIESVGLYIPGGTAVLFSTLLMLAIPAKIAGCKNIALCSPPNKLGKINPEILFIAKILEINTVYKIGGAQAIAALTYGTESVRKVNKIFGPGNQYVTAAKMLVSTDPEGVAIDMPAGPSEVLVIADENANPAFVAADLLSQAEHGKDSQVVLVSSNNKIINKVQIELDKQIKKLPRADLVIETLKNSLLIETQNLEEALNFSNQYAPEHLILNCKNPELLIPKIQNAGSVFIGPFSPESAGDYASGTNHALPTYGYAKNYSGVSVDSFVKKITFQEIKKEGLKNLASTITNMARAENLEAHARAVEIRFE